MGDAGTSLAEPTMNVPHRNMPPSSIPLASALLTLLLAAPAAAQTAGWTTTGGNPERTRSVDAPLASSELVPVWRLPSPGLPDDQLIADIDGDPAVEFVLVAAGRASAYELDGTPEWTTPPLGVNGIQPPVDLDGDGRPELILRASTGAAVLRGRDGHLLWQSTPEDLGLLGSMIVRDIDGDGLPDVQFGERDCGASRGVGRAIGYSFATADAPRELYRLEERTRTSYPCGRNYAFADMDGDGRVEVIAPGHAQMHFYSTEDGRHLGATEPFDTQLPYGIASPFVADVDGDGDDEVLLLTNNSFGLDVTSRRAMLLDYDADTEALVAVWDIQVDDVATDRHAWPATPLVDLDGDGQLEFVHAMYDGEAGAWETLVRSLPGGEVIARTPGRIVEVLGDAPRLLLRHVEEDHLVELTFDGTSFTRGDRYFGDRLLHVRHEYAESGRVLSTPLPEPLYLVDDEDAQGDRLTEVQVVSFPAGETLAMDAADRLLATLGSEGPRLLWLDASEGAASGLTASLEPLVNGHPVRSPQSGVAEIWGVYDSLAGRARVLSGAKAYELAASNLGTPASRYDLALSPLAILDVDLDGGFEWVGHDTAYRSHVPDLAASTFEGQLLWQRDGLVERSESREVIWLLQAMSRDLTGDGVPDLMVQTDEAAADWFQLQVYSGATGEPWWSDPYRRGSVIGRGLGHAASYIGVEGDYVALPISRHVYQLRADDGTLVGQQQVGSAIYTFSVADPDYDGNDRLFSNGWSGYWVGLEPDLSVAWEQRATGGEGGYTGGALTLIGSGREVLLAQPRQVRSQYDHNLAVLAAEDGRHVHRLRLEHGRIHAAENGTAAKVSLSDGVSFAAADGGVPLFAVGGDDGWVYLLDLSHSPDEPGYPENMLVWSRPAGAPVGPLSGADIDDDGAAELLVPTSRGEFLVFDAPTEVARLEVWDTNCRETGFDVDQSTDTGRFCARWTDAVGDIEGYVATLVDSETSAPIAGPVSVGTSRTVAFEDVRLTEGRRYHVEVQGYAGAGTEAVASRIYTSDGAIIVPDEAPPTISEVTATPNPFVALFESTTIAATLTDAGGLASYRLQIISPDGTVVHEDEQLLNATVHQVESEWRGRKADGHILPAGEYALLVEATDFTGNRTEAIGSVVLAEFDEGPFGWAQAPTGADEGCGCRVNSGGNDGGGIALVALAALLLLGWRRRR